MVKYSLRFTKLAIKDKKIIDKSNLSESLKKILDLISNDPFCYPPAYEKLSGNLKIYYSRRINKQHRLIYRVDKDKKEIYIIRMWTHYEKID